MKIKSFFAAFALSGIIIGAWCGFVAVDLSKDRYMPGQFGPFFEITRIKAGSVEYSFLEKDYVFNTGFSEKARTLVKKYRGLMPVLPQIFSDFAADGIGAALKLIPVPDAK